MQELEDAIRPGYTSDVMQTFIQALIASRSYNYPNKRVLRVDRVDQNGGILHPYKAEPDGDQWTILTYNLFTREFSSMSEADFIRLRPAQQKDIQNASTIHK